MKKSLFALSLAVLLFSCKKEETPAEFTATDLTGDGWVKGTTTKNVVTPNGTGGYNSNSRVPASGRNVTVRVQKSSLYPNSNALGADVYTGTTDANGYYSIAVKSNGSGVTANVVIDGFNATLDTIVNGVTKTGPWALYTGISGAVSVFKGQSAWFNHNYTATNISSNPNNLNVGTAVVTGSVSMNFIRSSVTGTNPPVVTTTNVPVPANTKVYLSLNMDPTNLTVKEYTTSTDANGNYTFNVTTVAAGTSGFNQNATIWVSDYARTRDTVKIVVGTATTTVPGVMGVYNSQSTVQSGVYNSEIRNAVNLNYSAASFVPN